MGVGGTTLRDSYHLGQTISNDYGRPYQSGFNNITGFSGLWEYWRFSLHLRRRVTALAFGPRLSSRARIAALGYRRDHSLRSARTSHRIRFLKARSRRKRPFRLVEGSLSFHVLGHEISGGKTDAWLSPAQGGSLAWSNNAENIYSFRINRVDPLYIPLLSKFMGPMRYDFFYGSLKGHTFPNDDWVHSEMFSFRPTSNFEFGFQRTIVFGGKGHEPVNLHTFLTGFFSLTDTTQDEKFSRDDPGARYTAFDLSYRLPLMRKYMTFYIDSIAHDDVTPISAPRRAMYRTGLYLSQFPFPKLHKLDMRVEGISTDPNTMRSLYGQFLYYEAIQRQAYTNKGFIMGDWIGREAKGGQAWLTWHFSGNEWLQLEYLNKKIPKDFIPYGTTQNQFKVTVVKRIGQNLEANAWLQYERWKAPDYKTGLQNDTVGAFQLTWYPKLEMHPQAR